MDFTERRIKSEMIYSGRMINMWLDTVVLPNEREATREWVEHPGAVAIVALDDQERVCMVRQYRYPVGQELLEIPAGKLSPGEDPLDCARRELLEEAGITAGHWEKMFSYYSTPGFCDEMLHLYLARDLSIGDNQPDEDEFLEVCMMSLEEARSKIRTGEIKDSKTLMGLLGLDR
ncbi:MAG: NUDIX hydrolase [Syntrophomonadaceae bacterium]|nr:NUDIX hydrolase [Syntrophomonadaceae bacterium]